MKRPIWVLLCVACLGAGCINVQVDTEGWQKKIPDFKKSDTKKENKDKDKDESGKNAPGTTGDRYVRSESVTSSSSAESSSASPSGGSAASAAPSAGSSSPSSATTKEGEEGWRGQLGAMFLGSEQGAVFYGFDTLAAPGKPVRLAARLRSVKSNFDEVQGATLSFFLGTSEIGRAQTDPEGEAAIEWTPDKAGDYDFQVRVAKLPAGADLTILNAPLAPLLVSARAKDTEFIVIDLDHTVVASGFFRVLTGGGEPMADSIEVTQELAKKYTLIYLTHRPDLMTFRSKDWLRRNGYPLGPLLVSTMRQAMGSSGKYKTGRIDELRKEYPNVLIGIGDKMSDAQAYVDNGMTAYLIPYYKNKSKSMREAAEDIRKLNGRGRLQVVSGWREILDGIEKGKRYPPERFAAGLERQARELDWQKKKKEKDD